MGEKNQMLCTHIGKDLMILESESTANVLKSKWQTCLAWESDKFSFNVIICVLF